MRIIQNEASVVPMDKVSLHDRPKDRHHGCNQCKLEGHVQSPHISKEVLHVVQQRRCFCERLEAGFKPRRYLAFGNPLWSNKILPGASMVADYSHAHDY